MKSVFLLTIQAMIVFSTLLSGVESIYGYTTYEDFVLDQFENGNWETKDQLLPNLEKMIRSTKDLDLREEIKNRLLSSINREIEGTIQNRLANKDRGEGQGETLLNMVKLVVNYYNNDPDIILSLLNGFSIVSSIRMRETISNFGDNGIDIVLNKFGEIQSSTDTPHTFIKNDIIHTIELMLKKKTLSPNKVKEVKSLLMSATKDDNYLIRIYSVDALAIIDGPDIIHFLEDIANNDDFILKKKTGEQVFEVREHAKRVLNELKKKRN